MFTLTVVLAIVAGLGFFAAGASKLAGVRPMEQAREHLGFASGMWKIVGALEVLGAIGLGVGLHEDLPIIGVLAAAGLVGQTIGATYYHQKAGDSIPQWLPAVVMGTLAVFYAIARVGSA